jgi:MoaA/NifB/PqqE/SkfB family radical SAM enzyme
MKEVKYKDFSNRIHRKAVTGDKRVPVNATFELTYRCNNSCVHCYCNLPAGDKRAKASELSLEEIEKIFDELKEMGCLWLLITGGEPLLRDGFSQVYLAAKRRGFIVTVFTNGILVDDEVTELFRQFPPFFIEITMYGATRETYEKVTRIQGSYDLYRRGLERLLKMDMPVQLAGSTTNHFLILWLKDYRPKMRLNLM